MSERHQTIPHTELYWAELDTSVLPPAKRRDPVRLGYLFESVLPCPIDEVHAVYCHPSATRTIACGIDRNRLAAARHNAVSLQPDGVPPFIEGADVSTLNLLVGDYEPDIIRLQRRRLVAWVAAALLVVTAVLGLGIERRILQERHLQNQVSDRRDQLYTAHLDRALLDRQPAPAVLLAELRRLRATRVDTQAGSVESESAAVILGRFMRDWPSSVETRTESIEVSGGAVRVSMLLDDTESAERFRAAYAEANGWNPDGHQNVDRVRDDVRLTMRVAPASENTP